MQELFVVLVLSVITILGLVFMVFQKKGAVGEGYNFISVKAITVMAAVLTAIKIPDQNQCHNRLQHTVYTERISSSNDLNSMRQIFRFYPHGYKW